MCSSFKKGILHLLLGEHKGVVGTPVTPNSGEKDFWCVRVGLCSQLLLGGGGGASTRPWY